jgi:dienelactone hydrolase
MTGSPIGPEFEAAEFTHDGITHQVFRAGSGPAVVVVHEVPNLHPGVVDFGRRVLDRGYTVFLPSLFGEPGAAVTGGTALRSLARTCVSREFHLLSVRTAPVNTWLRALASKAHAECGGPGVGAVGMCFTGGYALAMAVDPAVVAPVLSQPGIPAGVTARNRSALGLDPGDMAAVRRRAADGMCAMALRFSADRTVPKERFETLRGIFGDALERVEIDSSPGNPYGIKPRAHSVLTIDLVDEPGHPTREALDRVLDFLDAQLKPAA